VEFDRGANLLGALSLAVSDRMSDAISAAAEQSARPGSETAAEALSALHHFLDAPTIDRLRTVLGLTSSGTVRLVDRLEAAGYVERRRGATDRKHNSAARRQQELSQVHGLLPAGTGDRNASTTRSPVALDRAGIHPLRRFD